MDTILQELGVTKMAIEALRMAAYQRLRGKVLPVARRAFSIRKAFRIAAIFAAMIAAAHASTTCSANVTMTGTGSGHAETFDVFQAGNCDNDALGLFAGTHIPLLADAVGSSGPQTVTGSNGNTYTLLWSGPNPDTYTIILVAQVASGPETLTYSYFYDDGSADPGENTNAIFTVNITLPGLGPTIPGAPTIGTATAGNSQATVRFTAPASNGGSTITTYTATSSPGGFTGTVSGPTAAPITVTGLTNGTAYTFTVKATNGIGTGIASATSNSVTPATVPGAPTIGTATAGNSQATVRFTAPASNGGSTITTYTATSSPGGFTGTVSGPTTAPITVTGLTNGTAYTFKVTATNGIGTGIASATSNSVTPATVPGAPTIGTATAGNSQATVTFTSPASNGGRAITTYTATSSPGGFTGTVSGPTAAPITITGLTNGTAYTFTVTATNGIGTGTASAASNSVRPATVPGAPTIGTATGGNAQATVSFTAPSSNGGSTITGYTVTSSPGGFTGTGTTSPITVPGLTNGTAYTFTVTAKNSAGTGIPSATSNAVTPLASPTAGANNVIVAYGSTANPIGPVLGGGAATSVAIVTLPSHGTLGTVSVSNMPYTPTPGYAGPDSFTYKAMNTSGTSSPATVSITVIAPTLTMTPASGSLSGTGGTPFSETFVGNSGTGPYIYVLTLTSGTMPTGLSFSGGVLSGTPTTAGTVHFTVTATDHSTGDSAPFSVTNSYTLTVGAPGISITPTSLPNPTIAVSYNHGVSAGGGTTPYMYSITAGALPAGLMLDRNTGAISGTPTAGGTFPFTVQAEDSENFTGSQAFTINIGAPTISISPVTIPAATYGSGAAYSQQFSATGGTRTYTYTFSGTLPAGLTLSSTGLLSGTTTASGPYNFAVIATDHSTGTGPFSGSQSYSGTVSSVAPVPANDVVTVSANATTPISVTANDAGIINSVSVASQPMHGEVAASGTSISYTPTHNYYGADSFTYTATGPGGTSSPATVSVTVNEPPAPTAPGETVSTNAATSIILHVTANATGGPFTGIQIVTPPTSGRAVVTGLNIVYIPDPTITAPKAVTFEYTITTPFGTSADITVTVNVTPGTAPVSQLMEIPLNKALASEGGAA